MGLAKWAAARRRWMLLMGVVLLAGSAWIWRSAVADVGATSAAPPSPHIGFAAPDFTLRDLDGEPVSLSALRGQAVVVNFWASWCPPCRAEMPALQRVYQQTRERGLVLLAVHTTYQDSAAAAAAFVGELGLDFPILFDESGAVSDDYQLRAMPTTFFINRQGIIDQVVVGGPMSEATIRSAVEMILQGGQ